MQQVKLYNPNTFNAFHAALAFLCFLAGRIALSYVLSPIFVALYQSGETDLFLYESIGSIFMMILLGGIAAAFCAIVRVRPVNGGGFLHRKGLKTDYLMAMIIDVGLMLLLFGVIEQFSENVVFLQSGFIGERQSFEDLLEIKEDSNWIMFYLVFSACVIPAIFEELVFRGIIMRGLLEYGKIPAVIISSMMFSFAHGSFEQMIFQFIGGLTMGFVVLETRSLVAGMVMHFANNAFSTVYGMVVLGLPESMQELGTVANGEALMKVAQIFTVILGLIMAVASLVYWVKHMFATNKKLEKGQGFGADEYKYYVSENGAITEYSWWQTCAMGNGNRYFLTKDSKKALTKKTRSVSAALLALSLICSVVLLVLDYMLIF